MFLRAKIKSSSIAEMVIAISIIALCVGIGSLIYVRTTRSATHFQDVRNQTEIQSELWKQLYHQTDEFPEPEGMKLEIQVNVRDSIDLIVYRGTDDKIILKQEWIHEE